MLQHHDRDVSGLAGVTDTDLTTCGSGRLQNVSRRRLSLWLLYDTRQGLLLEVTEYLDRLAMWPIVGQFDLVEGGDLSDKLVVRCHRASTCP